MAKQTFKSLTDIFLADATLYNKAFDTDWFNRIKAIAEEDIKVEKPELTIAQQIDNLEIKAKELMKAPVLQETVDRLSEILEEAEALRKKPEITIKQLDKLNVMFMPLLLKYMFPM